jgi:lipoate---protein ligase
MRCRVIKTLSVNPFFNIAYEEKLFRAQRLSPANVLYLWRNSQNVVIGKNQNAYKECNLTKMWEHGVQLVRRKSGGGAVYQDLGNSIFTILSPNDRKKVNNEMLIESLKKLGVLNAEATGRNDICVNGKKISGAAFRQDDPAFLHHGTMLLNLNFSALKEYLTPNKAKLQSKGAASVESRVTNISNILNRLVSHWEWCHALEECFRHRYKYAYPTEFVKEEDFVNDPEIKAIMMERQSTDWIFGGPSEFTHHLETRFHWASVDVHIQSAHGLINNIVIYSDSLYPEMIDELVKTLTGLRYDRERVAAALGNLALANATSPFYPCIQDFSHWICAQLTE